MLESIQIRNFAIIDSLQLELESGLSALTGETGAGKSILLDAIKLAAGDRADSDSLRNGAERAEIAVCFRLEQSPRVRDWLSDNELDADGECLIRRVLYRNGRSKAFINGSNATLAQLRQLCDMLIDIHGQHEHQSLQQAPVQRQLLDAFIGDPDLIDRVRDSYRHYRDLRQRLQQLRSGSQEREQRIDLLRLYCAELDSLALADGEFEKMQQDYRRLANAGKLLASTGEILGRLYDDEQSNVQAALSQCARELAELAASDAKLDEILELVNAALIQVEEASAGIRDYRDGIELDSGGLESLNERIAMAQNLARKHRVEAGDLPTLQDQLQRELETLDSDSYDIDALEKEAGESLESYRFNAAELSARRRQTAAMLSEQITQVMQQLGMDGGHFLIEVESAEEASAHGSDTIRYLVSANPGQPPKPLSRVASGGELSRISLAIQVIMSESSQIPTLIFDEVDSGVGGAIAEIVGKKLRLLGHDRQVLCVTHLAQVASQAHHHFRVEKSSFDNDTRTAVFALDADERREEIARMLGGVTITEQSRAHASEMIASAE